MPAASIDPEEAFAGGALVGIVGYSTLPECFPFGPRLALAIRRVVHPAPVHVENMTWGPLHIVQRFQDAGMRPPERVILVGAASVCAQPGRVGAFRWLHGTLPAQAMQERIYEAVTGVIDIENTLAIGAHFGIWPQATFTVEAELPADLFGAMVMAESEGLSAAQLADRLGFSPQRVIDDIAEQAAAILSRRDDERLSVKSVQSLAPVVSFARNLVIDVPAEALASGEGGAP